MRSVSSTSSIRPEDFRDHYFSSTPMTVNGTVVRTALLLAVTVAAAAAGWFFLPGEWLLLAAAASIAGAIAFTVWARKQPLKAKAPAIGYAAMQGVLVGAISRNYAELYDGIIYTALIATGITVVGSLILYATGVVRVSQKARSIIAMLTLGAFLFYGTAIVLALFGLQMPGLTGSGIFGYGLSALMLALAVANLFSDYSIVDEAVANRADERFEWFAAFGLVAVIIWIYIEFLRLFARSR